MSVEKGPPSARKDLFGGRGTVKVWDLLEGAPFPPFWAVLSCELEPSGFVGAHRQEQLPEIVVGLQGDGIATVDKEPFELCPGDVVCLPLGSVLTIRNRSATEPLRYLIVKAGVVGSEAG